MSGTHAREAKENVNILVMKREWWMKVNRTLPTSISFQNLKLIPHFITPTRSLPSSLSLLSFLFFYVYHRTNYSSLPALVCPSISVSSPPTFSVYFFGWTLYECPNGCMRECVYVCVQVTYPSCMSVCVRMGSRSIDLYGKMWENETWTCMIEVGGGGGNRVNEWAKGNLAHKGDLVSNQFYQLLSSPSLSN